MRRDEVDAMKRQLTSTRSVRLGAALTLMVGMGAAGLVGVASPASAAVTVANSASNGKVGVTQTVSATVDSTTTGTPAGTVSFTANGQAIGSGQVGGSVGNKAQIAWTPSSAASTIVEARFVASTGEAASDSDTVTISKVDTATSIPTPVSAVASARIPFIAMVRSRDGSYVPTGQAVFSTNDGKFIGTSSLDGSGRASVDYTVPSTAGTVYVFVSYAGDGNANASKSAKDTIKVTTTASTVTLTVAQTNYVNTSVALLVTVNPATRQAPWSMP